MAMENELILSMLSAASSLQKLNEKLDSISLHSLDIEQSSQKTKATSKEQKRTGILQPSQWQLGSTEALLLERGSLSGLEYSDNESSDLRLSNSSSKFDSAFGSQTDEESTSVHFMAQELNLRVPQYSADLSPRFSNQAPHERKNSGRSSRSKVMQTGSRHSQKRTNRKRHHHHDGSQSQQASSLEMTPNIHHRNRHKSSASSSELTLIQHSSSAAYKYPVSSGELKRIGSTRSISSTLSSSSTRSSSSKILSLELSADDLSGMACKGRSNLVSHGHSPMTISYQQPATKTEDPGSDTDTTNSGASTPVVSRKFQLQTGELFLPHKENDSASFIPQQILDTSLDSAVDHALPQSKEEHPLTPNIIVINSGKGKMNREKDHHVSRKEETRREDVNVPKPKKVTIVVAPKPAATQQSPNDSIVPQPSSRQHQKIGVDLCHQRLNAPKRRTSILQRLKRRRGSFKAEKHQKRHVPVKRSFSDRMAYDIRKGWIDYEEDLEFISNPCRLRRVGRMIARKAGTLHIVQLNRPPSGIYGIYISQTNARPGIFISRFADSNAAKFYTGLLSPGDEIIQVNKEDVKDKSVDYVYDMLEKLDTVIFSIVPVCSRPDW